MSAAPTRMTATIARLLMTPIAELNQLDFKFGLNFAHLDRRTRQSVASRDELGHISDDDILDVGHPVEGQGNRSGVYIDLNRWGAR